MHLISTLTLFALAMVWPVKKYIRRSRNKKRGNNNSNAGNQIIHGHYEGHWD